MSRPKSIILLLVWFLWATGKDLDSLARFSITSDYYIYSAFDLPWLFFVMAGTVFLLNVTSVWYLYRPEPIGQKVLIIALLAGVIYDLVTLSLALTDINGVREAYTIGRELRGLPVREAALDTIFTTKSILTGGGLTILIYSLLVGLVVHNKVYFHGPDEYGTEA